MTADEPFRVEVTIAAPADVVWHALRDKDQVRRWHGWQFDGLDQEVDAIFFTDTVESPDERRLVTHGGDTFDVIDLGERSVVRMTRAPRDPSSEWDAWYEDINEGWTTFMHQLQFMLERHRGEDRRTVLLEGAMPSAEHPLAALGLLDLAAAGPGTPYSTELLGEAASGEVFFTSAHQAAFTVAPWGDGLIIFGVAPPSSRRPAGAAMAVVTTYGLPDDTFEGLAGRWTTWWGSRYPKSVDREGTAKGAATAGQPVQ